MTRRSPAIIALIAALAAASFMFAAPVASANQSTFCIGNQTSGATTSPTYMTAGTATTSLSLTNTISRCTDRSTALTEATLILQFTGSSTSATLNGNVQYSMDGIDWYENSLGDLASTSPSVSLSVAQTFQIKYASTTPGLGAAGANSINPNLRILKIPTPTQWVRVLFTLPPGSTNGAVWAMFIGKQEQLAR